MRKKGKLKELKQENNGTFIKNSQFDTISKIDELKILAEGCLLNKDYDNAVNYSEKIIRIAIKTNMRYVIKEQDKFLKKIAEIVQEDYFTSEIGEAGKKIKKIYDVLLTSENIVQAHEIVESFKQHYKDNPFFNSIPLIQDLIKKDEKEMLKYNISREHKDH